MTELNKLINSTRGAEINSIALKKLFEENGTVLQKLRDKSGIPRSLTISGFQAKKKHTIPGNANFAIGKALKPFSQNAIEEFAPYDISWRLSMFSNGNMPLPFDTAGTVLRQGKLVITSNPCSSPNYCYLGIYMKGLGEVIKVPDDPAILAARIKMEYSFDYDAWDSYGAKNCINLVLRTSSNFASTAFSQLPDAPPISYASPSDRWKIAGSLLPWDSVTTDFNEFHAAVNSTVTVEGYVTPGSDIDVRLGFAFPPGTNKGITGCYHHGVFKLKKIIVTYLKSTD